jgi:hypothetical protein
MARSWPPREVECQPTTAPCSMHMPVLPLPTPRFVGALEERIGLVCRQRKPLLYIGAIVFLPLHGSLIVILPPFFNFVILPL